MKLEFLSRSDFRHRSETADENTPEYLIPQGGYGIPGAKGAAEMLNYTTKEKYTHVCCACGTGLCSPV
jgi:1-aminocyclopropane-1-carboxylate deaminase